MFGATDKGMVRTANQDAYYCSAEQGIAIVSDGMGGHKGGERASQLTTDGLRDAFAAKANLRIEDLSAHLDEVLQSINLEIHRMAQDDENLTGMGATVNYLHFHAGHLAIGHAGDSRTYLIRSYLKPDGKARFGIWQLTVDHNVESFLDRGLLIAGRDVPEGPLSERQKSRLTRGMGVVADLKADLYYRRIEDGDVYLTCSDGLHGFVRDRDILEALASGPIARGPERLIDLAKKAGAPDNVTVVISVLATDQEPLLSGRPALLERSPFLVREPSGQISPLLMPEELIRRWMGFEISNDAEICAASGKWVFLQRRNKLFKTYPVFDTPNVRERLDQVAPQTGGEISMPEARSKRAFRTAAALSLILSRKPSQRSATRRGATFRYGGIGIWIAAGGLALIVFALWWIANSMRLFHWVVY
jgi:serine/threonine protein phosphatase PrpC